MVDLFKRASDTQTASKGTAPQGAPPQPDDEDSILVGGHSLRTRIKDPHGSIRPRSIMERERIVHFKGPGGQEFYEIDKTGPGGQESYEINKTDDHNITQGDFNSSPVGKTEYPSDVEDSSSHSEGESSRISNSNKSPDPPNYGLREGNSTPPPQATRRNQQITETNL